jgi:hypothetical protein
MIFQEVVLAPNYRKDHPPKAAAFNPKFTGVFEEKM